MACGPSDTPYSVAIAVFALGGTEKRPFDGVISRVFVYRGLEHAPRAAVGSRRTQSNGLLVDGRGVVATKRV